MSREGEDAAELAKTRHIDEPLGGRLRLERAPRMSREDLADYLEVSVSTVQRWENGSQRIPAARLWQICRRLNLDVASLFADLPHHVAGSASGVAEPSTRFDHDDGRPGRAAALAKAAARLPPDRLEIAETLVRALRPGFK